MYFLRQLVEDGLSKPCNLDGAPNNLLGLTLHNGIDLNEIPALKTVWDNFVSKDILENPDLKKDSILVI